jgi:hypothetical protein
MRIAPLIAILACAACAGRPPAPVAAPRQPPPLPLPAETALTIPVDTTAGRRVPIAPMDSENARPVCVIHEGRLQHVQVRYTAAGDTTYQGVPFSQAFPLSRGYAAQAEWYLTNEPIAFGPKHLYVRYGYPRVLDVMEVQRVGEHHGVGIYVRMGDTDDPQVIYIPVRPGCEFQPYQVNI